MYRKLYFFFSAFPRLAFNLRMHVQRKKERERRRVAWKSIDQEYTTQKWYSSSPFPPKQPPHEILRNKSNTLRSRAGVFCAVTNVFVEPSSGRCILCEYNVPRHDSYLSVIRFVLILGFGFLLAPCATELLSRGSFHRKLTRLK